MAVIEFHNVSYTYRNGSRALEDLNLSIEAGTFACIVGSNGSGKSTLAKHMNALLAPTVGTVRILGRDVNDPAAAFEARTKVGMVFQNPDDQLVASVVEDDVAFGPGNLGVPQDELRKRVTQSLSQVSLSGFEKTDTASLSGGQKQLVAIAGVLAMRPDVIVLDEPSSMLDPRGRANLMGICHELNDAGLTVVLVTHFMEEAAQAHRVIVLDRGRIALDGTPREVLAQVDRLRELSLEPPYAAQVSCGKYLTIDELMAHEDDPDLLHMPDPREMFPHHGTKPDAAAAIGLEGVTFEYDTSWSLRDITFDVLTGEFFGIAGHTGSGKSTLIQLASGLLKPTSGTVSLCEQGEVGVVFQYPERQLFAATVFDDVAFGPRNLGLGETDVETRVYEALESMHLDVGDLLRKSPFALSGGIQRRVAIAGVLAMHPRILIFDEPAAGLDPLSHKALLDLVIELHAHGITVILVSHDMDDLAQLCDRIAVLNDGRLEMIGSPCDIFSDEARIRAIGLEIPQFMQLERRGFTAPLPS